MSWLDLEMMARGGTLALLALWSLLLWRDHRKLLAARIAILMNIGIASYVFEGTGWSEQPNLQGLLQGTLARSTPALFWLFSKTWFNDRTGLSTTDTAFCAAYAVNALVMHLTFTTMPTLFLVSAIAFRVGMFGFSAAALWEAWRSRDGDLIEARRRLRLALVVTVGSYVLAIALAEMVVYNANGPRALIVLIGSSTVLATLILCLAMFALGPNDLFGATAKTGRGQPQRAADADPLVQQLQAFMAADLPHRDERLTIAGLAARLGVQEYQLRRVINLTMGHRNFSQFLNGYRLAEVRAALSDQAQREVPILTIALDAGFGSLGPFNRAFREAEGMTPSHFRQQAALVDSEIS